VLGAGLLHISSGLLCVDEHGTGEQIVQAFSILPEKCHH